jgi:hypothetical protein
MRPILINRKISFLLLILIGFSTVLISCDSISTDTTDKIKSQAQDVQNKLNQTVNQLLPQTENGANQASPQLSPPIATVQYIGVDLFLRIGASHNIFLTLKPTNIAVADERYVADLYEKGTLKESIAFTWNQPEINVLKEKVIEFSCTQQEYDAYRGEDISHIFSVSVHE